MIKKIFTGAILLTSLSLCVAARPTTEGGASPATALNAKRPSRLAKHTVRQKDHRLARAVVKAGIRHRQGESGLVRLRTARAKAGCFGAVAAGGMETASKTDPAVAALSNDFRRQKGRLAWPLAGTVSMAFGPHEYIHGIIHDNQSATIDCAEGSVVKAVYAGEVTAVSNIAGVWCVILRHGNYYTAYSNLARTTVVQGDQVQAGEPLGSVGEIAQLEFMVADEHGRFYDPEVWLKR